MEEKLQMLTEKIYSEGITKANEEASKIIDSAKKEATSIIAKANKEAEQILAEADKKVAELRKNVNSELVMSSKQAISALRQDLATLITAKSASESVAKAFDDAAFVKKVLNETIKGWNASGDVRIILPEKDAAGLDEFITNSLTKTVDKGITVEHDGEIHAGFKVSPADNSFQISFTDKDFEAFFKNYIRPRTNELLYGGK
ncbi:MAG: hypothetical protein M0O94_03710 [Bacteroidales bacterium]|nr:hypothetical protein [Bacteroidales bacterium]